MRIIVLLFLLTGCLPAQEITRVPVDESGGGSNSSCVSQNSGNPNATYTYIRNNIINNNCASCHVSGSSGGWNAANYAAVMQKVSAGNLGGSSLYQRAVSANPSPMPPSGLALSGTEVQALRDWIEDCAPNN